MVYPALMQLRPPEPDSLQTGAIRRSMLLRDSLGTYIFSVFHIKRTCSSEPLSL